MDYSHISIRQYAGGLGAWVDGVDLSKPLDDAVFAEIHSAWLQNLVLFFRDQHLAPESQLRFARRFGSSMEKLEFIGTHPDYDDVQVTGTNPDRKPELFVDWHCDVTWQEVPTLAAVLCCIETPEGVGDTLWSNMYAPFDDLSPALQAFLEGLTGVHDPLKGREVSMVESLGADAYQATRDRLPCVEHPVVVVHPETGRKLLYVNPLFLSHIRELERPESDALLDFLFRHIDKPEYQCRLRWEQGTVAFWDNRCTMHKVVNDYWPQPRKMHRIAINAQERPHGVKAREA